MKNYHFKHIIISSLIMCCIVYSCTKTEPTPTPTPTPPPVVIKLTSCDSLKQGLLKTTSDTIRLVSCLTITGCDSLRLGFIKPTLSDTLRLISCIKITGCDSLRLGILKPTKNDTLRLTSCIKITGCDSLRLGILKPSNKNDTLRLISCIKITGCDSLRLGLLSQTQNNLDRLTCNLLVGQIYKGGVVAYIYQPGDPGYDPNTLHGIIASENDLNNTIGWHNGTYIITGANKTALGTGLANTDTVIKKYGVSINYAAGLARAYKGGGYSDWHLPSKDELNKLYLNRVLIGGFKLTPTDCINGNTNSCGFYWSSSEASDYAANAQYFVNGSQGNSHFKYALYSIRAIRIF